LLKLLFRHLPVLVLTVIAILVCRGLSGQQAIPIPIIEVLLIAPGGDYGIAALYVTNQHFRLSPFDALAEISLAKFGNQKPHFGDLNVKHLGTLCGRLRFLQAGYAIGNLASVRAANDALPAFALSLASEYHELLKTSQFVESAFERQLALLFFDIEHSQQSTKRARHGHGSYLTGQGGQTRQALGERYVVVCVLREKVPDGSAGSKPPIQFWVRTSLIGSNANEVFRTRVDGHQLPQKGRVGSMLVSSDDRHKPADGIQYFDRGVPSFRGERP
jgi:hypothetical protein